MIKEVAAMAKIESHNTLEKYLKTASLQYPAAITATLCFAPLMRLHAAESKPLKLHSNKILHPKLRAKHWINLFADSALYWLSAQARC